MENWQIDHKDEGGEIIKLNEKSRFRHGKNRTSSFSQSMQEQSIRFHSRPSSKAFLVALWSLEYQVTKNSKPNTYI